MTHGETFLTSVNQNSTFRIDVVSRSTKPLATAGALDSLISIAQQFPGAIFKRDQFQLLH